MRTAVRRLGSAGVASVVRTAPGHLPEVGAPGWRPFKRPGSGSGRCPRGATAPADLTSLGQHARDASISVARKKERQVRHQIGDTSHDPAEMRIGAAGLRPGSAGLIIAASRRRRSGRACFWVISPASSKGTTALSA